ncbi:MAG: hypothetical protein K8U57_29815 [Planctomycetes bacterium]|nr:hypothetical protein [Planctomycetota bacterium]
MGYIRNLLTGVANGATRGVWPDDGIRKIQKLCARQGRVVEKLDETGLVLRFNHPLFGSRPLLITVADHGGMAVFTASSNSRFPANTMPPTLAYSLLLRNKQAGFSSWGAIANSDGTVTFAVSYTALLGGLEPSHFQVLCETMCQEVFEFDSQLLKADLN